MEKRLFVAGLPFSFTDRDLADLFAEFGVVNASVITDRETGRSKGFGFVELDTPEAAKTAIEKMNGAKAGDRSIIVNLARPKEDRPRRDFGGGDRGGNRGGRDFGRNDSFNKKRGGFGGRRDSR